MADSGATYRSRNEVQDMRHRHDCVEYIKHVILSTGVLSEGEWEVSVGSCIHCRTLNRT